MIATRRFQTGSSLIEVLIALFVLAVGMLGVLAMQSTAVKTSKNASLQSQAQILAFEIYEAMQSAPADIIDDYLLDYGAPTPNEPSCTTSGTACTSAEIVDWNQYQWLTNITASLPGGAGAVGRGAQPDEYIIRIQFATGYEESDSGDVTAINDEVLLTLML